MIFREIWTDERLSVEASDGIGDTVNEEVVCVIEIVVVGDGKNVVFIVGKQRQSIIVVTGVGFFAIKCILVDERGANMGAIKAPYLNVMTTSVFKSTRNTEVTFTFRCHNRTFNSTSKSNRTREGSIVCTVLVEEMEKFL